MEVTSQVTFFNNSLSICQDKKMVALIEINAPSLEKNIAIFFREIQKGKMYTFMINSTSLDYGYLSYFPKKDIIAYIKGSKTITFKLEDSSLFDCLYKIMTETRKKTELRKRNSILVFYITISIFVISMYILFGSLLI